MKTALDIVVEGIILGIYERAVGVGPVYFMHQNTIRCDEFGYVRSVNDLSELSLAAAYIRGFTSLDKEIN